MPYRYFIKLSFDGTYFCGWQRQPNGNTVQALLEDALRLIAGISGGVTGCGRTDAGVHARLFFAHFDTEKIISSTDQLAYKMNRYLPPSIAIQGILPVLPGCNARFSASSREYKYAIARKKDPFLLSEAYLLTNALDIGLMNAAAETLLKYHDFQCFSKTHTQVKTFLCDISYAKWEESNQNLIFTIRAERFLRNMVRAIVGTLLDVGRQKVSLDEFHLILQSQNRSKAGYSVPAKGLTLTDVVYPPSAFSEEPVWFPSESAQAFKSDGPAGTNFQVDSDNDSCE